MGRLCVLVALAFAVVACGDDDDGDATASGSSTTEIDGEGYVENRDGELVPDLPDCDDQYVDGEVVSVEEASQGCMRDGEWYVPSPGTTECADGRTLVWNDLAWWYEGEGVHVHKEGGDV